VTEAEWLPCADPAPMFRYLEGRTTDRKYRLFQVACCRGIWDLLPDDACREGVLVAERYADGEANDRHRQAVRRKMVSTPEHRSLAAINAFGDVLQATEKTVRRDSTFLGVAPTVGHAAAGRRRSRKQYGAAYRAQKKAETHLLRCVFGNPFRPVALDPAWRTEAVVALATGIYEERAFERLPVLADALDDAGCANPDALAHCRGDGPHARGCWVVDLLLGKT
jgi:hypothetical protein